VACVLRLAQRPHDFAEHEQLKHPDQEQEGAGDGGCQSCCQRAGGAVAPSTTPAASASVAVSAKTIVELPSGRKNRRQGSVCRRGGTSALCCRSLRCGRCRSRAASRTCRWTSERGRVARVREVQPQPRVCNRATAPGRTNRRSLALIPCAGREPGRREAPDGPPSRNSLRRHARSSTCAREAGRIRRSHSAVR